MTRANTLIVATVGMFLSGCDPVVPETYRGESRLTLSVGVFNSTGSSVDDVVPALAHVDDERVSFRPVDYQSAFAADFRVVLYDPPGKDRFAPLDRFLAPDVIIARELLGAVIESRLDEPIKLDARQVPLHPDCWNGGCDFLPGAATEPCAEDDEACLARQRQCPNGTCQLVKSGATLPEGVEDVAGFSAEYEVLYTPEAIPARSWAAWKLGAPKGLKPGYHLAKRIAYDSSSPERFAVSGCQLEAVAEALARFNEEHETEYDELTLRCLRDQDCTDIELPKGAEARALASQLTEAEIERGCLELAPDVEFIEDPEAEQIAVRIDGEAPDWLPSVIPEAAPIAGGDEIDCQEENTDEVGRPALTVSLTGYTGSLCPEGSMDFSDSDGAFGISHVGEVLGKQRCEIGLAVKVPAGYRFRRPIFIVRGFALRETESVRPAFITMSYAMAGEPMSSQHPVSGLLDGDYFTLLDTPEIGVPECSAECESADLELRVDIEVDSPEGTLLSIDSIECQHELGVEWTTCDRDFARRR
ncbi:MAG TPA: DUF4360 domain-containing protein [Polyangiales bacterium]|nr:DUF4360 domain-containing protein [Polyangiales bacterium]